MLIMDKILLYNYSLSLYFSRGNKELVKKGAWFLISSEFFCLSVSVVMVLISIMPFRVSGISLILMLGAIWYFMFYYTKAWTLSKIGKLESQIKKVGNYKLYRIIGMLLYFGSFFLFLLIGILTFEGYLIN